jgi:hypothetical protein
MAMDSLLFLKGEHREIEGILMEIESFMDRKEIDYSLLVGRFHRLNNIWDEHEAREESFFGEMRKKIGNFPVEIMFLEEHRQLRGHWKVIHDFLKTADENKIRTALDTDGRMFIGKLRKHMKAEDEFFDSQMAR